MLVLISLGLGLVLGELGLRAIGRGPWQPFEALAEAPTMTRPDASLGWAPEPGRYRWRPDPQGDPVSLILGEDGARGPQEPAEIHLFGGSFTQGFGLDEDAHWGRELSRETGKTVRNHGVPGYGTLQSRMLYEQLLGDRPGLTIVYGLVDLHDARNACTRSWLHTLERAGSHHPWVQCPWAAFNGEVVLEYPPRRYRHWWTSEYSALVHLLELASIDARDRFLRTKTETTLRLIAGWRDRVERRGGRFVTAMLWAPSRERAYRQRLDELGVDWVALQGTGFPHEPGSRIPMDGHPSASVHRQWASELAAHLKEDP